MPAGTLPGRHPHQPVPDDDEAWAAAGEINQRRPHWLAAWGTCTRQFIAFAVFPVGQQAVFTARYPGLLAGCLDAAGQRYRIQLSRNERP